MEGKFSLSGLKFSFEKITDSEMLWKSCMWDVMSTSFNSKTVVSNHIYQAKCLQEKSCKASRAENGI